MTRVGPKAKHLVVEERHTLRTGGEELVSDYTFEMRRWTEDELRHRLSHAGFGTAEYFGAYDPSTPAGTTDRLVCAASLHPLA